MGYQDSVNLTQLTETYLDEANKQNVMKYASAAARTADAALTAALREGMLSYLDDLNVLQVYTGSAWSTIGPVHGALTNWTTSVLQPGAISHTISRAVLSRTGRWISGQLRVDITGTGTVANPILLGLPFTAVGTNDLFFVGTGKIYDASAGVEYTGFAVLHSTSSMKLQRPIEGVAGAYHSFALGAGDAIAVQFQYEAAGDA